ncbi:MAG: hypothetical protein ABW185_21850, partial [Sedimenticola sp.]
MANNSPVATKNFTQESYTLFEVYEILRQYGHTLLPVEAGEGFNAQPYHFDLSGINYQRQIEQEQQAQAIREGMSEEERRAMVTFPDLPPQPASPVAAEGDDDTVDFDTDGFTDATPFDDDLSMVVSPTFLRRGRRSVRRISSSSGEITFRSPSSQDEVASFQALNTGYVDLAICDDESDASFVSADSTVPIRGKYTKPKAASTPNPTPNSSRRQLAFPAPKPTSKIRAQEQMSENVKIVLPLASKVGGKQHVGDKQP